MSTNSIDNDILPTASVYAPSFVPSVTVSEPELEMDSGAAGGAWSGGAGWSRGGRGDENNESDYNNGPDEELSALLRSRNALLSDVPVDMLHAYKRGLITVEHISNFFIARTSIISSALMSLNMGFRNRFLADRLFLLKIGIEQVIGVIGKLSAEYQQRGSRFWAEKEFVFANLITGVLADFALVYLPAPTVNLSSTLSPSSLSSLPTNIFQTNRPFTLAQRLCGFGVKATQLFAVGFVSCLAGILFTNGCMSLREKFDSNYSAQTQKQSPFLVPLLYATFLAVSSGTRYQLVAGVEDMIFPRIFRGAPKLAEEAATFALRYTNTFWGSSQWVTFCRITNAQKLKPE